jgi:hypothetical protein
VAAALKLTSKQRERIRAIDEETFFAVFQEWKGPGGPSEEARKANEQKRKVALTSILELLTADQKRQWKEMTGEQFKGQTPFFPPFFPGPPPGGPGERPLKVFGGPQGAGPR